MTEKKKYLAPQTEVLDLRIPQNYLACHSDEWALAKENSFDDEDNYDEDDNFSGWGDWPSNSSELD